VFADLALFGGVFRCERKDGKEEGGIEFFGIIWTLFKYSLVW
jgi:hypothetical protein